MKMPVMDGTQLLKNLEELHIDSKISVISGFSDFKYTRLAIQAGVIDYILKPALAFTSKVIGDVFDYINAHYLENISLADIAESFFSK